MIAYVDNTTGKIFGAVHAETEDALNGITKVPDGCRAVYVGDLEYPDLWAKLGEYTIGEDDLPIYTPIPDTIKLQAAIDAKLVYLKQCETDAMKTFQSSALGPAHTYVRVDDNGKDYSELFNGEFAFINSAIYDGSSVLWYTVEAGNVTHTKDQFNQVYTDGRSSVASAKYKRADLEAKAKAVTIKTDLASALSQLDAITW